MNIQCEQLQLYCGEYDAFMLPCDIVDHVTNYVDHVTHLLTGAGT